VSTRAGAEPGDATGALRLLKTKCFSCHNEQKRKGGLVMTSREMLLKGDEDGAVLVVSAPAESRLIAALAVDADPHMPPKKQLSAAQIELLSAWVKAGAPWDTAALIEKPRTVALAPLPPAYHPVLALALSPDARRLAVCCGNELVLYEVGDKGLRLLARAHAHPDPLQSVTWSPDGTRLATGAFRRVVVWNAHELTPECHIISGLTDRITALRFMPGGNHLVIADGRVAENGTVRIADVASGGIQTSWSAHDDTIFDLAVSSDGQVLATAGGDKLVKLWDLGTQTETARIEAHPTQVLTLAFNADDTRLVTGGADQQLKVWDVKSRDQISALGKHSTAINAVAWAPTGAAVVAVTDAGELFRYTDFKSHTGGQSSDSATERKFEGVDNALCCVAVSANAERIFAGSYDGRVLGWNKDGKVVDKVDVNENDPTAVVSK
jgi:WD40 repeat protein